MELPTSPPTSPAAKKSKGLLSPRRTPGARSTTRLLVRWPRASTRRILRDREVPSSTPRFRRSELSKPRRRWMNRPKIERRRPRRRTGGKSIGSLRAAAEAGRGAPLLPKNTRRRRVATHNTRPETSRGAPCLRAPSVPAVPKGWISVKIMPSSCVDKARVAASELSSRRRRGARRACHKTRRVMGKGDGDDSDSGDENRPPRTHRRRSPYKI